MVAQFAQGLGRSGSDGKVAVGEQSHELTERPGHFESTEGSCGLHANRRDIVFQQAHERVLERRCLENLGDHSEVAAHIGIVAGQHLAQTRSQVLLTVSDKDGYGVQGHHR